MSQPLPDLDQIWNPEEVAQSEKALHALLPLATALTGSERGYCVDLLTRMARAQCLQGQLTTAQATLEQAKKILDETPVSIPTRIRWLLESSRLSALRRIPSQARAPLLEVLSLASQIKNDEFLVQASQLMAEIEPQKQQQEWLTRAVQIAENSTDPQVRRLLGGLYTASGWKLFEVRQFEKAIDAFKRALGEYKKSGTDREAFVAQWSIGKALRFSQKTAEALAIQKELLSRLSVNGLTDGRLYEELAECLQALRQEEEAKGYFELAYRELIKDQWFVDNEPGQLKRLKELGKVKG